VLLDNKTPSNAKKKEKERDNVMIFLVVRWWGRKGMCGSPNLIILVGDDMEVMSSKSRKQQPEQSK